LRPLVVQTEHLDPAAAAWLAQRCELVVCPSDDPAFPALLARAAGLAIRTYTLITPALLEAAPNLRVVARAGVGLDNVNVPACQARNVAVVSTPDANTRAVVELILALILDATRPRPTLATAIDMPAWKALRQRASAKRQLCELTLGVWGLGKIGSQVARAAQALEMPVLYHDLLEIPSAQRFGATPVSRQELCQRADVLTIHVDGRATNRALVSAADLTQLKADALLINASRGFVLDHHALAAFLIAHPLARAMLDVHEPEPITAENPLLGLPNATLYPHIASATALANRNMSRVVEDLWRVLAGEVPLWPAW